MLTIDDKVLRITGLDYAAAIGLMEPGPNELVVHIKRELDAPQQPQRGPVDTWDTPPAEAISLRVIADRQSVAPDGGHVVRHIHEGQPPAGDAVPTIAPTNHPMPEDRGHNLGTLQRQAKDQRLTLVEQSGVYTLISAFGMRHYQTLAQVSSALRLRRYD